MQVIVFTGGGTGGHVYPGLAVIQALRETLGSGCPEVVWVGSKTGMERGIVEAWGLGYRPISTGKLRRYWAWKNFSDAFRIAAGYIQSRRILKRCRPLFVFSKGGFVSVPLVRAAASLKIPVYSHESDLDPGLATRLNLKASHRIFCAYHESAAFFPEAVRSKVLVSGNPIRKELLSGSKSWVEQTWPQAEGRHLLLVLGGSQGAAQINRLVWDSLSLLQDSVFVVHQTGTGEGAPPDDENYVSRPTFGPELAPLYARATVLLSRAGAGTLWEAAACQVPMILLPLSVGSRGDQVRNAELFSSRGAALLLSPLARPQDLIHALEHLLRSEIHTQHQKALAQFQAGPAANVIVQQFIKDYPEALHV